ncbi:Nucleotide-diphospho-sugar transferases protein [Raphanus sativus]|nr:Nucleotide-diphospho-sugar transferases protein [Raphanus sativus]
MSLSSSSSSSSSSQKTWIVHGILAGTAIAAAIGARAYLSGSRKFRSRVVGIIPARYASSRFEGKPLVKILGKPMIQRTWERSKLASTLDHVVVATDDERIADCCRGFGADVIMTSESCRNGLYTNDFRVLQKRSLYKFLQPPETMLQLLVSIQALILNQKPYFNEPGYEATKGTTSGEAHSKVYSENVFILSLKTMVYSMRKPPKHFEEFVLSHYFVKALDIVRACNAYKNGAPVGSIVKGGVQGIEETSQSGSKKFRTDVAAFTKTVAGEFVKLGVKELEEKPKPPPVVNANTESNTANRKRSRSSR